MSKKLPVAEHLKDKEYKILLETYANHNSSMGLEQRRNYTLSDIVKVERNIKEKCLHVHFANGEWWKYYSNGTWG